jgi:hypothetical protein
MGFDNLGPNELPVRGKTRAELEADVARLKAEGDRTAAIWNKAYENGSPFGRPEVIGQRVAIGTLVAFGLGALIVIILFWDNLASLL